MPWKFPLFIVCKNMSDLPRRYNPSSDFSIWFQRFSLPLIIGEIISGKDQQDRYRMLVQAVALARVVFALTKPDSAPPFIVAIYLTEEMVAERYILMKKPVAEPDQVCASSPI
jgi:hypothetical protein